MVTAESVAKPEPPTVIVSPTYGAVVLAVMVAPEVGGYTAEELAGVHVAAGVIDVVSAATELAVARAEVGALAGLAPGRVAFGEFFAASAPPAMNITKAPMTKPTAANSCAIRRTLLISGSNGLRRRVRAPCD
jgi:hypothetical protein